MNLILIESITLGNALLSISILAGATIFAWLSRRALAGAIIKISYKTNTSFKKKVINPPSLTLMIILAGTYLSILILPLTGWIPYALLGIKIVLILLGIWTVSAIISDLLNWIETEIIDDKVGIAAYATRFLRVLIILSSILLGIILIMRLFNIDISFITDWINQHGWQIILIVILTTSAILVSSRLVPKFVLAVVSRRLNEPEEELNKRVETLSRVLINICQISVFLAGVFTILSEIGIDIAPILAGAGVLGLAIGLGAQSLIKDLLAGLFVIIESQYHVGDVIKIADISGLVEDINLRRTVLRDLDGIVHTIPNGHVTTTSNLTKEWSRVNLNVSVAYKENLDKVIEVINRVGKDLTSDPKWAALIIKAPQVLRVDNLGESGIEIKILGDTKPIYQWDVMGELRKRLKEAFDKEGIEIPWPHTKVHFGDLPFSKIKEIVNNV